MAGAAFFASSKENEHGLHQPDKHFYSIRTPNTRMERLLLRQPPAEQSLTCSGGPSKRTPAGIRAPSLVNRLIFLEIQQFLY